jgi:uncharacterized membrane protein YccC
VFWLHRHDPHRRALHKGVRCALVSTIAFGVGRFWLDDNNVAVLGVFTAFALSAMADFGGPPRLRARAYVVTGLLGVPLVALGTAVSETTAPAAAATFVVAFAVAFGCLFGVYAASAGTPLILFFVVAAGVPAPDAAIGPRLTGLAVGCALAALGGVFLWPQTPRRDFLGPLAAAAEALGAWVRGLAAGRVDAQAQERANTAVGALRPELARIADRPAGPAAVDRGQVALVHNLDRACGMATRLAGARVRAAAPAPAERALLLDAGAALTEAAGVLRDGGDVAAGGRLQARLRGVRGRLGDTISRLSVVGQDGVVAAAERAFVVDELASTALVAAGHAPVAAGRGGGLGATAAMTPDLFAPDAGGGWSKAARRRLRLHLTPRSRHFRGALRTAIGLAAAMAVAKALDLQHGFWVVLATLVVMQASARATSMSALEAAAGTLVGFALSLAVVLVAGVDHWVYVVLLPLAFFASVFAAETIGLVAGQASFALLVVVLFNLLKPATWKLGLVRVEDVLVGGSVGLLAGLLIWPRGAAGQLRGALATLLRDGAAYAASVVRARVDAEGPDVLGPRRQAIASTVLAEDAFAAYLAQRRPTPPEFARWLALLVAGDGLWYTADRAFAWPAAVTPACPALTAGLEASAARLERDYDALADALAAGDSPPAHDGDEPDRLDDAAARCAAGAGPAESDAVVGLLWTRCWTRELLSDLPRA